jgi:hypothetical protein
MSKFQSFLEANGIDPRRILAVSREIEKLRPEDREIRLIRRQAKASEKKLEGEAAEKAAKKPRSGRPITERQLRDARAGKPLPGPAKTRLVRALNHLLGQKKKDPADLRALF